LHILAQCTPFQLLLVPRPFQHSSDAHHSYSSGGRAELQVQAARKKQVMSRQQIGTWLQVKKP